MLFFLFSIISKAGLEKSEDFSRPALFLETYVTASTVDRYLTGRTNSEAKRIKLLMDNMDGWKSQRIRMNGQRLHGYMREV